MTGDTWEERLRRVTAQVNAEDRIIAYQRACRRDGWIVNAIALAVAVGLVFLLGKLA